MNLEMTIKRLGLVYKIRVGRATGNENIIYFLPYLRRSWSHLNYLRSRRFRHRPIHRGYSCHCYIQTIHHHILLQERSKGHITIQLPLLHLNQPSSHSAVKEVKRSYNYTVTIVTFKPSIITFCCKRSKGHITIQLPLLHSNQPSSHSAAKGQKVMKLYSYHCYIQTNPHHILLQKVKRSYNYTVTIVTLKPTIITFCCKWGQKVKLLYSYHCYIQTNHHHILLQKVKRSYYYTITIVTLRPTIITFCCKRSKGHITIQLPLLHSNHPSSHSAAKGQKVI